MCVHVLCLAKKTCFVATRATHTSWVYTLCHPSSHSLTVKNEVSHDKRRHAVHNAEGRFTPLPLLEAPPPWRRPLHPLNPHHNANIIELPSNQRKRCYGTARYRAAAAVNRPAHLPACSHPRPPPSFIRKLDDKKKNTSRRNRRTRGVTLQPSSHPHPRYLANPGAACSRSLTTRRWILARNLATNISIPREAARLRA